MTDDLSHDLEAGYRALRGDGGVVRVPRDFVRVAGPQALEYLQGQLSQDLSGLDPETPGKGSVWSFVLQPTGKVDAWLRVTRRADEEFVLDVDGGFGDAVIQRLLRFKLRTKADVDVLDGWQCWSMHGGSEGGWNAGGPEIASPNDWPARSGALGGVDFLGTRRPSLGGDLPEVGIAAREAVRIECGVPKMGAELTDGTIPAEAGQWIIDRSVSFTKGCYTGQELVARIDSRGGNVPRHLRGLVVDGDVPPVGAAVLVDGAEVGILTSVARSADRGPVALAYVARKVDPPANAIVRWSGAEVPAAIEPLPLV